MYFRERRGLFGDDVRGGKSRDRRIGGEGDGMDSVRVMGQRIVEEGAFGGTGETRE